MVLLKRIVFAGGRLGQSVHSLTVSTGCNTYRKSVFWCQRYDIFQYQQTNYDQATT